MNKIVEEAMTNMIRRIEALEEFNKKYYSNQQPPKQFQKQGSATTGQLKYIRMLGGSAFNNMTKQFSLYFKGLSSSNKSDMARRLVESDIDYDIVYDAIGAKFNEHYSRFNKRKAEVS